jgi:hypothetical protein
MTHLSRETIERLNRKQLAPGEMLAALRHIGGCPECASAAMPLASTLQTIRELTTDASGDTHLDPEIDMFPYVENRLHPADREVVESHLDECAMCRAEIDDLRSTAQPRRRSSRARLLIATAAAAVVGVALFMRVPERTPAASSGPPALTPPASSQGPPTVVPAQAAPPTRYASNRWEQLVSAAVQQARLPRAPVLARLNPPEDLLRGDPAPAEGALAPAGVVIEETRPRFSWPDHSGATYVVSVFDQATEIASSDPLIAPAWRPPRPLPEGRIYVWQVAVAAGGSSFVLPAPPAPPAMFRIISVAEREEIGEALRRHPDDHLLHATLFAAAGLEHRAQAALERAAAARQPGAAEILAGTR